MNEPLFDTDSSEYGRPETGVWADEIPGPYGACDLCGESFKPNDERAEMYDPRQNAGDPDRFSDSVICHAQCGLDHGMEIA